MGMRLAEPSEKAPWMWIARPCPCCGAKQVVVNGAWLQWKRLRAGLTQREFGKRVGVSSPYLSDLESNRRDCPLSLRRAYEKLKARR